MKHLYLKPIPSIDYGMNYHIRLSCAWRVITWIVTWISVITLQVVAGAADAGGVQRMDAERSDLTAQTLNITVFTVQGHLHLQSPLRLLC